MGWNSDDYSPAAFYLITKVAITMGINFHAFRNPYTLCTLEFTLIIIPALYTRRGAAAVISGVLRYYTLFL